MQLRKPTKSKGTKTKNDILAAFTTCVRNQGYPKTTMVDVAKEAKLFPSNLFYYFESKDELLRVCFKRQCDIIVHGLEETRGYDLEEKIGYIADFLFSESESVNHFTTGFMYEAIGVSVSDSILRQDKREMDRRCKKLLADVFIGIDVSESVRDEKADILYSLLAGSKLNGYFDPDYNSKNSRNAFTKVFHIFCDRGLSWPAI